MVGGRIRCAVRRRRKILLVPPALRPRLARLNSDFSGPPNSFSVPAATQVRLSVRPRGGAPSGNQNALKHGKYTRAIRDLQRRVREHIRECRAAIAWANEIDRKLGRRRVTITEYHDDRRPFVRVTVRRLKPQTLDVIPGEHRREAMRGKRPQLCWSGNAFPKLGSLPSARVAGLAGNDTVLREHHVQPLPNDRFGLADDARDQLLARRECRGSGPASVRPTRCRHRRRRCRRPARRACRRPVPSRPRTSRRRAVRWRRLPG